MVGYLQVIGTMTFNLTKMITCDMLTRF